MVKPEKEDWERFGRASKAMAPELVELSHWRNNPRTFDVACYYAQIVIHRAHTVMLCEENIIKASEAKVIIKVSRKLKKKQAEIQKSSTTCQPRPP